MCGPKQRQTTCREQKTKGKDEIMSTPRWGASDMLCFCPSPWVLGAHPKPFQCIYSSFCNQMMLKMRAAPFGNIMGVNGE